MRYAAMHATTLDSRAYFQLYLIGFTVLICTQIGAVINHQTQTHQPPAVVSRQ